MSADEARLPLTAVARPEQGFARSVRRLRLDRGWSQGRLAGEAGISARAVWYVEAGEHAPSLRTAWRIAEALEVTVDAMIRGEVPRG